MRLKGIPPEGVPAVSYVGKPQGTIVGSADRPVGKIISVPGNPGRPGDPGPRGDGLQIDGAVADTESLPTAGEHPLEMWVTTLDGNFWLSDGTAWYLAKVRGPEGPEGHPTWDSVEDKPSQFPPTQHTHQIDDVVGLQSYIDNGLSTKVTQSQVDATVDTAIEGLIGSAPEVLDSIAELADAIGDDPNFSVTVSGMIAAKADRTTTVTAGPGLTGGGDLSTSRTLAVNFGTASGTVCQGNDSRLSDARTPTAHSHSVSEVSGLQSALDSKAAASLLPVQVTQAQYDAMGSGRPARLYAIVG
ncbi:tail protein [Mycobacterium phage EagleEye]|uniref:Minor tail protein n=1 Tax=Mycobacterium phage EagleEye TaxID=1429759 RepID=W0LMM3_9CAUD|nr:tail protein [Mycobacterium phage EagleEye]AHG23789.1 hypothetical protein PBI_EAGLEEYE_7 [Mycobacterium phage EagleEye]